MNREQKRMLQRQRQLSADGTAVVPSRAERPAPRPRSERVGAGQFLKEVRGELRRVAWPTRGEVAKYSLVVLMTLIFVTLLIFGLDYAFGKGVLFLFDA